MKQQKHCRRKPSEIEKSSKPHIFQLAIDLQKHFGGVVGFADHLHNEVYSRIFLPGPTQMAQVDFCQWRTLANEIGIWCWNAMAILSPLLLSGTKYNMKFYPY